MNLFGGNPKLMLVIDSLFVLLASLAGLAVAILILQTRDFWLGRPTCRLGHDVVMLLLTPDSLVDERLASSLRFRLVIGWLTATLSSIAGLYASYKMDLPTGAAIVCALGLALILAALATKLIPRPKVKEPVASPKALF